MKMIHVRLENILNLRLEYVELMSLKMYSDTNHFQQGLRKAFWTTTSKEVKSTFYHWAMQLYKAALYHGKPIPPFNRSSKNPRPIFHGMYQVDCGIF